MQTIHIWTILNLVTMFLHIDNGLMSELSVFQSPANITLTEGDSVQMNCTFEGNGTVGRVGWRRASQNVEVLDRNPFYQNRLTKSGPELFAQQLAFIKIVNLTKMDSDFYYCEVEIPTFGDGNGTGTQLIITEKKVPNCPPRDVSTNDGAFPLTTGVLSLFSVIIILLLCRLYYQSKVISRLKGPHTVTQSGRGELYEIIELQVSLPNQESATPSDPRYSTLPLNSDVSFPDYSTVNASRFSRQSIPSNQPLCEVLSTFQ
ncbi:uncharacterized protein [Heptranchias perlo]|uniref:uncharacterized protein n=1 Tax=Heptranchias perlo TaxID=212740 RepID=UPI00355A1FE8